MWHFKQCLRARENNLQGRRDSKETQSGKRNRKLLTSRARRLAIVTLVKARSSLFLMYAVFIHHMT